MISNSERIEILNLVEDGKLDDIFDNPLLYDYWESLSNDFRNELKEYDYNKKDNHEEFLLLFAFGKASKYIEDLNIVYINSRGLTNVNRFSELINVDNIYNKTYYDTEINTIDYIGESSENFDTLDNNSHKNFKYNTQRDEKVRPKHKDLEGVIRSKDDPFWNTFTPPIEYNCRCYLTTTDTEVTNQIKSDMDLDSIKDIVNKSDTYGWNFNAAKSDNVFPLDHTYLQNLDLDLFKRWKKEYNK